MFVKHQDAEVMEAVQRELSSSAGSALSRASNREPA
jgi:hypothetical protein